jgi:5-hydroxyisourate hydrolase
VGDLGPAAAGRWRLRFATAGAFYPEVTVEFVVTGEERHLHLPLLINPFGYSTYRGS